jgi:ATP-dependent HslUV protease ATP-binding subunit HslU
MVQREKEEEVIELAESLANERIIDILFPENKKNGSSLSEESKERSSRTRSKLRKKLENGDFEDTIIEIEIEQETFSGMQVLGPIGMDDLGMNIKDMLSNAIPKSKKPRKMPVSEAREVLIDAEAQKLIDNDEVIRIAKDRAENNGIIFIDEIDKVVNGSAGQGPDVSREGVQRDLLPIVEGSNVNTKYGVVSTDHILFIAAGAFHISTPSEMIPELQGRFPIRVELDKLKTKDFIKILTHPKSALIKQYVALLEAEGVSLEFDPSSIKAISELATEVNTKTENIGARRLHTIMTTLLEQPLFEHPKKGQKKLNITAKYVKEALGDIVFDEDLSRYIL